MVLSVILQIGHSNSFISSSHSMSIWQMGHFNGIGAALLSVIKSILKFLFRITESIVFVFAV